MDIIDRPLFSQRFIFFVAASLIAHILLLAVIQWIPFEQKPRKPEKPLIAKLVTPEMLKELIPARPPDVLRVPVKPERERMPAEKPMRRAEPEDTPPKTIEDKGKGSLLDADQMPGKGKPRTFREDLKVAEKKAIDKIVAESEAKKGEKKGEGGDAITFSTEEFKYYGYKTRLKEKIEGIWKYPREAAEKGIYGDLVIQFTILKDGTLGAVELIRTSGYKMLDDAAMQALRDAEPFWPLPKEWTDETFTIRGHFVYTLGGYYIR